MNPDTLDREWSILTQLLPAGWREAARDLGALRRGRQVSDPDTLLRLILLHVAAGLSLVQASARAKTTGLADISSVALHKRLRSSAAWLHWMASQMYAQSPFRSLSEPLLKRHRMRVVDATHVSEPGSSGANWRVHYVVQLPSLECDFFEVTDASQGETFERVPIAPGDLMLGDRGYARRRGIAHVLDSGADVLVRLNQANVPLLSADGSRFDLIEHLSTLQGHEPGEWPVFFEHQKRRYRVRLCAVRKTEEATERSRTRILRLARKRGHQARTETLEAAAYVFVLTSLDTDFTATDVLRLYRARWQIELAFKRMKSLFQAGHVPKSDPVTAQAWLHTKLLAALLIERLSEQARSFSPWGFQLPPGQPLETVQRSA